MRLRRSSVRDVYEEDGRCAVFVNGQVVVLSEIATSIFNTTSAGDCVSLDEVTHAVIAEFGRPAAPLDALEVTRGHVLDMVAHKVLWDSDSLAADRFTAAGVDALRSALRHVVSDDPSRWRLSETPSSGHELATAARRHRLAPALTAALHRLDIPPETAAQLAADSAREASTVLGQAEELGRMFDALERAGVRALNFKGLALSVQAHGDVHARGPGDHDLLVDPTDVARAHGALTTLGWEPTMGFPQPGESWAWRHLIRDFYELPMKRRQSSVDLHWHLGPVRAAFPEFEELWRRRTSVTIGGREIPTLSPYDALAHSASHAAKDNWRLLRSLLDVHRLMADPLTWHDVDRQLRRDQVLSIGLAASLFGVPDGAPAVVVDAARRAAGMADAAIERQGRLFDSEASSRIPGAALAPVFIGLGRAGAGPHDLWRLLSTSMLPPIHVSDTARHATVAVPRGLVRRGSEVGRLWLRASATALQRATDRTP